jgi:hypothetical protein
MKIKHLKTFENFEKLNEQIKLNKSNVTYEYSEDEITINCPMTKIHKEIILKFGRGESIFPRLTLKSAFKKDTWNMEKLPYINDLYKLGLIMNGPLEDGYSKLTEKGREYFEFLNENNLEEEE